MLKKFFSSAQSKLFVTLLGVILLFGIINPTIFTVAHFYSLLRTCIVPAMLAFAIMLVMATGESDMAYCIIAVEASYIPLHYITDAGNLDFPLWGIFALAIGVAVILELFTWVFVSVLHLNSFIVTIGYQTMLKGAVLIFVSTNYCYNLPTAAQALGTNYVLTAAYDSGTTTMVPATIFITAAFAIVLHLMLQYTNFGRQMYAVGGDADAAKRAGINVSKVRLFTYIIVGIILGTAGVMHDCMARCTMPISADVIGTELNGIAAVTLGRGGKARAKNSVLGTLLGVFLIQFINTNLIMIGIPTTFQKFVTGIIILVGFTVSLRNPDKLTVGTTNKKEERV